jgi:1-acyl-sn-glycerol-3-phosphate acyltransferase
MSIDETWRKLSFSFIIACVFYALFWFPLKLIFKFFLQVKVKGQENTRDLKGPLIIVVNHASWTDPFVVATAFSFKTRVFPIRYACLWKYFYFPLLWPVFWPAGAFPVWKGKGLERALKTPLKILENNGVVGLFPEGRRQRIGDKKLSRPKRGAAFLAYKTGAKLLPVKVEGHVGMRFHKGLLRKYKIKVKIGKPFNLAIQKVSSVEDYNQPAEYIMEKIRNL